MSRILVFVLCLALIAWVNPQADKTKEGNRLYKGEQYDEAMAKYTEALIELPNSPYLHFNIGNAAYKKEDYEEAIKSFSKSASLATDVALEGKSYYNLGNCKYRQGRLKENTDLAEAISIYREALDYYKQAIDKNPKDSNSKYNHEFVERKIKELLDKQKEQQQQQNQQQQQQKKSSRQQNQKEQEDESEEEDNSKTDSKGEGEPQEKVKAAQQQQKGQDGQNEDEKSRKKENLTKEEAKMLLDSLRDEELSEPKKQQNKRSFPQVLRDW